MPEGLANLQITLQDMAMVMKSDPLIAEKGKNAALLRVLVTSEEARLALQEELDTLKSVQALSEAENKQNGHRKDKVPQGV